jgi:hypothetical protein
MNFPTHGQSGVENHLMLCPISFQLPSVLMLKKKWSDMMSARMRSRLSTTCEKRREQETKRTREQRDKEELRVLCIVWSKGRKLRAHPACS